MRLKLRVRGTVQGVGFRPFAARTAHELELRGHVRNGRGWVDLEVQGAAESVERFLSRLRAAPAPIRVESVEASPIAERSETAFLILESDRDGAVSCALPPDLALCVDCAREIRAPGDRRFAYPFTNCTRCGPRYSIVEQLPYDRAVTSMRDFALCSECSAEYADPADRRYHAEPLACPACGPELALFAANGTRLTQGAAALEAAARALLDGRIVALKGLGGFQLLVLAADGVAVAELRCRKRREAKPFAVMFASLAQLQGFATPSAAERELLSSAEAPIVLLGERAASQSLIAAGVSAASPRLGAMLPTTPLHALLLDAVRAPLVCTSGNRSDEPLCTELEEAMARLSGIADLFLSHDRRIVRPLDDSVARITTAGVEVLRRARGYAPRVVAQRADQRTILALGAHQKSTIALLYRGEVVVSQHLADLGGPEANQLLQRTLDDLLKFFDATPELIACDLHPDYVSSAAAERVAARFGAPLVRVQHHVAHVAAVCGEHHLEGAVLGLAWDGTGLGEDGNIWGGEALLVTPQGIDRFAHLAPLPLLGGERAAREPWRCALGALTLLGREAAERHAKRWLQPPDLAVSLRAIERGLTTPCGSVGRCFDAMAALLGIRDRCTFEGQAALELEALAETALDRTAYPLPLAASPSRSAARRFAATPSLNTTDTLAADTRALFRAALDDHDRGAPAAVIARRFHNSLIAHAVEVARHAGVERVVLSGGCFQNRLLAEGVRSALEHADFRVHSAGLIPCNDGGISLGQLIVASRFVGRGELAHGPRGEAG